MAERKALQKFKELIPAELTDETLWGVNLMSGDEQADVLLSKFLRARNFNVNEALSMLEKCLLWRKEIGAEDNIIEEDLGFDVEIDTAGYIHKVDRKGRPVLYETYSMFQEEEMYEKYLGGEMKLNKFVKWRVQVFEKCVRLLDFHPGGVNSCLQVVDTRDLAKSKVREVISKIFHLFEDNYPGMIAKKVYINVPWYFCMLYGMIRPFLGKRSRNYYILVREGNVAETLCKYINLENIPVQYGGLSRTASVQERIPKPATEFSIRPGQTFNFEIDGIEAGETISWEVLVCGWELSYSAKFISECGRYKTEIQSEKWMTNSSDQEPIYTTFVTKEAGRIVVSIDNKKSWGKRLVLGEVSCFDQVGDYITNSLKSEWIKGYYS